MKYAFNDNGVLRDVVQANPAQIFDLGYASQFIEVSDDAQNGWLWDGEVATPPPPPSLTQVRAAKVAQIKAERDRRTQTGGFPAAGKWFHSDVFSRGQLTGLVIAGQNIPPDLMWKTMDGTFIAMTPTLAQQIFASAASQDAATFKRSEELQFFANTQPDPDGLVLSGWPPIYGE